jgi:hypothetical protein
LELYGFLLLAAAVQLEQVSTINGGVLAAVVAK